MFGYTADVFKAGAISLLVVAAGVIAIASHGSRARLRLVRIARIPIVLLAILHGLILIQVLNHTATAATTLHVVVWSVAVLLIASEAVLRLGRDSYIRALAAFLYLTAIGAAVIGMVVMYFPASPIIADLTPFDRRLQSWFANSTMFGFYCLLGLIACIYRLDQAGPVGRAVTFASIPLLLAAVAFAGGRTALVVGGLVLPVFMVIHLRINRGTLLGIGSLVAGGLIAVGASWHWLLSLGEELYILRRIGNHGLGGFGGRVELVSMMTEMWSGATVYSVLFGSGTWVLKDAFQFSVHSGMARIAFEYGMAFVVVHVLLVLYTSSRTVNKLWKGDREVAFPAAVAAALALGEFSVMMLYGVTIYNLIWLMALLPLIMVRGSPRAPRPERGSADAVRHPVSV